MAIKEKDESGISLAVPFNQVDNLSTKPAVAPKPEKGIIDKIVDVGAAAALEHNWFSQAINEESNPYKGQKPNPAYNPYGDDQLKGYEGPLDWFATSNSKEETSWRLQQYSRKQERQATLKDAGGWGTAAEIAAGLFTPDILIGGGVIGKAVKVGHYAKAAITGAETGAISGALYGMGQNQIDSSRDGLDIVKDAGAFSVAGAVLGPVLHGAGQLIGKKARTTIPPVLDDHVPGPADIEAAATYAKQYGQHMAADVPVDMEAQAAQLTSDINARQALEKMTGNESMDQLASIYHSMPDSLERESVFEKMVANAKKDTHPDMVGLSDHEIISEVTDFVNSGKSAAAAARQMPADVITGHVPPKPKVPYVAPTVANTDLVGSFGANKVNLNQAGVTLANSSFTEFKLAAQKLFHDMRMRVGNLDGSWTNLQSAESELRRLHDGAVGQGHGDFNNAFREYFKSGWETPQTLQYVQQKYGKNKLTMKEFDDEIGIAMSNADRHAIGEVQKVAQSGRVITEGLADEARRLGLLDTSNGVKNAASYFGRNYNKDKIIAQQVAFRRTLSTEFQRTNPTWTQQQLDDAAMNVYEQIIRGSNDRLTNIKSIHIDTNGNIIPLGNGSKSAVAMERKLEIDDNVLEPWLNKSYRDFVTRYSNTIGSDVALTKMIGDTSGAGILERALAEKQAKAAAIEANASMTALEKEAAFVSLEAEFDAGRKAINNGISILRGEYKVDTSLPKSWATTAHALTTYSYITKMGGAAISSIGDFTKTALYFGMSKPLSYALPALRQGLGDIFRLPSIKDPMYDAMVQANKRLGVGMEIVLHTRHAQINDLVEKYSGKNPLIRGLDWAADKMGVLNGLAHLTDFQKQLVGVISNDEIIRSTIAEVAGKASERELRNLRVWGITPEMSQRIASEFQSGVVAGHNILDRGFHVTDTLKWADKEAADTLERALTTMNNTVVYTPSAGAKVVTGLSKSDEALVTQFMSFNFGSHIQHFTQMMQQIHEKDASVMGYIVSSLIVGAAVYELKNTIKNMGKDVDQKERNFKETAYDVISESSLMPIPFMINNFMSGVGVGDARRLLSDDDRPTLAASNFNGGVVMGATGQLGYDAFKIYSGVKNDTMDKSTLDAAVRMTPFNNLFYLRPLFNIGKERAQDYFDLPDKATATFTVRK